MILGSHSIILLFRTTIPAIGLLLLVGKIRTSLPQESALMKPRRSNGMFWNNNSS